MWWESILTVNKTVTFTPELTPLSILYFYAIEMPESTSSSLLTNQDVRAAISWRESDSFEMAALRMLTFVFYPESQSVFCQTPKLVQNNWTR